MVEPLVLHIETRENLGPITDDLLPLATAELTVKDLISLRVLHRTATLPSEEQRHAVRDAVDAFRHSAYLVIVDNDRVTDLGKRLTVSAQTRVQFWRLTPLVGG